MEGLRGEAGRGIGGGFDDEVQLDLHLLAEGDAETGITIRRGFRRRDPIFHALDFEAEVCDKGYPGLVRADGQLEEEVFAAHAGGGVAERL